MKGAAFALLMILCIDVVFYMAQLSIEQVDGTEKIMNYDQSFIKTYDAGGHTVKSYDSSELPTGASVVDSLGNLFTDLFNTIKGWIGAMVGFVDAFPTVLRWIGIPGELAFPIAAAWHGAAIVALVMFLRGD